MSKFLILLFGLILSTNSAFAGPGDGPIVPWPSSMIMESPEKSAMLGSWVAYHYNSVWLIDINKDYMDPSVYELKIYSHALHNHLGYGRIQFDKRAFWGTLYMDTNHSSVVYIFREGDGTPTMRIGRDNGWEDIHLYRSAE